MKKYQKYDKKELQIASDRSSSLSGMMQYLNIVPRGRNYSRFRQMIIDLEITTDHWKGRVPPPSGKLSKEEFISKVLVKNGPKWGSHAVKQRCIEYGILLEKCVECSCLPIWNNKKLVLHLDHIDGDFMNNELNNLRLLCPNCHSQTETYCKQK